MTIRVRKTIKTAILALLFVLCACTVSFAQGGGKAEPNRIEFKRGATRATINGTVRGDEQAEYVLGAKKGQRLVIQTNVGRGEIVSFSTTRAR